MVDVVQVVIDKFSKEKGSSLNFRRRRRKFDFRKLRIVLIYALEAICVIAFAYVLIFCFGHNITNLGESMSPTIQSGDVLLIDRVIYNISSPKRDDIIVFRPSGSFNVSDTVKRIVGIPGDRVQVRNGALYVNDEIYDDAINTDYIEDAGLADSEIVLGEDEYFVLGDNRNNSEDSRYETVGNVERSSIIGKIWFNVSPSNFGLLE